PRVVKAEERQARQGADGVRKSHRPQEILRLVRFKDGKKINRPPVDRSDDQAERKKGEEKPQGPDPVLQDGAEKPQVKEVAEQGQKIFISEQGKKPGEEFRLVEGQNRLARPETGIEPFLLDAEFDHQVEENGKDDDRGDQGGWARL